MGFFFWLGVAETAIRPGREGGDDDPYEVEKGWWECLRGWLFNVELMCRCIACVLNALSS